jgi:hypothetical protein
MRIKFTWKKLAEILRWILPIISKGGNSMDAPKGGLLTAPTVTIKAAALVPGTVVAGVSPESLVVASTGTKISWAQVGALLFMIVGILPAIGQSTGWFHIDTDGQTWQGLLLLLGGFTGYRMRVAMPPTRQ